MKNIKRKRKYRYRNVNEVLSDLKDSINFLSRSFKIPGRTKDDLWQEMIIWVVNRYKKNPLYYKNRKKGWWFIRLRWLLMNLRRDTLKIDPLAKAMPIHHIGFGARNKRSW